MAETTKSTQEEVKTEQPSGGGQARQTSQATSGGAARRAREHSSFRYDQSGSSSTMEREAGRIMDYSRENPGRSTLIAFGVGVGVGLLMAGGIATRSRTQRIVPPVMNALSEIARELFR